MTKETMTINGGAGRARWQMFGIAIRFGLAGIANTVFGYAVFAALILLGCPPFAALLLALIAGVAWNFQTSKRFVFRSGSRARIWRFMAVYLVVLAVNWIALRVLRDVGLTALVAQALLAAPLAVVSYLGQRAFVFHGNQSEA